jgi:hypothetical protein
MLISAWSIGIVILTIAALSLITYNEYVAFPHSSDEVVVYIGVYPDFYKGQAAALKELSKEVKLHPQTSTFKIVRTNSFFPDIFGDSWNLTDYYREYHEICDGNVNEGESDVWDDVTDANINVAAADGTGYKSFERQGCTLGL